MCRRREALNAINGRLPHKLTAFSPSKAALSRGISTARIGLLLPWGGWVGSVESFEVRLSEEEAREIGKSATSRVIEAPAPFTDAAIRNEFTLRKNELTEAERRSWQAWNAIHGRSSALEEGNKSD
jgi:hypothetical protein